MDHKINKKTLVFGASVNPHRASYVAIRKLQSKLNEIVAIGGREGSIGDLQIEKGHPILEGIHTVTIYMGAKLQKEHEDYILSLQPKRIIFNPGAENPEFEQRASEMGIEAIRACTSVLVTLGKF
ncbi:MAG TPA: CoA-binding protein [Saprospiraceae bacterium]|nr:CoA-binding protein [Saprospiraceae bacterium]